VLYENLEMCSFICVIKTNLMHYLSSVYFVNQPLHVSSIFVTHHQKVYCVYTQQLIRVGQPTDRQLKSTARTNSCIYIYIYSIPPDDGLQICPKHVRVDWRNELRINSASSWFLSQRCIEKHGQQNIKSTLSLFGFSYWIGSSWERNSNWNGQEFPPPFMKLTVSLLCPLEPAALFTASSVRSAYRNLFIWKPP